MNVGDALRGRRTVRAFLPRPVPRETLEAILSDALRTPSWANTQPWEIFVAGGEVFERIRRISEERTLAKISSDTDVPFPGAWTPECRARTKELTTGRADVRGTTTEDAAFHHEFLVANRRFFEAPCAAYLCMDQTLSSWSIFDLGAMCQSICLAAQDHGVDSAIAINLVIYPDVLRDELRIPRNLLIVIGIALGYADPAGPEDAFRSVRRPLDDAVRFVGI
jgi:nitroreductase